MGDDIIIDWGRVERVVESYVIRRDAMTQNRGNRPSVTHSAFIQFCNDQSTLLNQAFGMRDEKELNLLLIMTRRMSTMSTDRLNEGLIELLLTQIGLLGVLRMRKAAQN